MPFSVKVKVILPKKLFSDIHVQTAIARKQREVTAPDVLRMFYDTTEGWETDITFKSKQIMNTRRIAMQVFPYGHGKKVYSIVNFGSPAHTITAKRPSRMLKFQTGYRSATRPGQLMSSPKRRFGKSISTYTVNHPGFEARLFDEFIADQYAPKFKEDMETAVAEAITHR